MKQTTDMSMMTRILRINPLNPEIDKIKEAARIIKNGGLVAFPTETVYGIGADAFNGNACKDIFKAKRRPMDNPLIVHISKLSQLDEVAESVPEDIIEAVKTLWPGPVTFVLKKNRNVPKETTAGLDTITVRMPAHPIALRLIDESAPIAAPSANISTRPSSTKVKHVIEDFNGRIDVIIDGGNTMFGLESTIIDTSAKPYKILRPGAYTIAELRNYLDIEAGIPNVEAHSKPIAPGMKYRHYAPQTMLVAVNGKDLIIESAIFASKHRRIAVLCANDIANKITNGNISVIRLGNEGNLYEIAGSLFDSLRGIDKLGVDLALIQVFGRKGIGLALMDRITKASGYKTIESKEDMERMLV